MSIYLLDPGECYYSESPVIKQIRAMAERQAKSDKTTIIQFQSDLTQKSKLSRTLSLIESMDINDQLVVYCGLDLAHSLSQVLQCLNLFFEKKIKVHFVHYQRTFVPKVQQNQINLLQLVYVMEADFKNLRTIDAQRRRRSAGLSLGRPKGHLNKSLKLDPHRERILHWLGLGLSRAAVAKMLNCHPTTLSNWLKRNKIASFKYYQSVS